MIQKMLVNEPTELARWVSRQFKSEVPSQEVSTQSYFEIQNGLTSEVSDLQKLFLNLAALEEKQARVRFLLSDVAGVAVKQRR